MERVKEQLMSTLIRQDFRIGEEEDEVLSAYRRYAEAYVKLDNSIVILSDFRTNRCYLHAGTFGAVFGLPASSTAFESAFEDCIFSQVHPDDLKARHLLELDYFRFQQGNPVSERKRYNTSCRVRIRDVSGTYRWVTHRTCYVASHANGTVWLALCFYAPLVESHPRGGIDGKVVDNLTGSVLWEQGGQSGRTAVLSARETEVLRCISRGMGSKEIAEELHIAVYTVYRHRQNIIGKLRVANTAEAVQAALVVGLI